MAETTNNWAKTNGEFLAKALAWLRLALEHRIGQVSPPRSRPGRRWFGRRATAPAPRRVTAERVARAADEMAAAASCDPPPALPILAERLGLSDFERHTLLLAAAPELDPRVGELCALAQNDPARPYPTFALALRLFDRPAWDVLSPERPLRYWRLLEISQPASEPLTTSALRADERIVNFVKGLNYVDDRLTALLAPIEAGDEPVPELPPSQLEVARSITRTIRRGAAEGTPPVLQLLGLDGVSKQLVAARVAAELGLRLFRLPQELLPGDVSELETLTRLWQRESLLLPLALYLETSDELDEKTGATTSRSLVRFLTRCRTLVFLDTRELRSGVENVSIAVDVAKPTAVEQQRAWEEALESRAPGSPGALAGQFHLNLATIRRVVRRVSAEVADEDDLATGGSLHDRLWDSCLMETRPRLEVLAQRIEAKATWNDIVLPAEERALLKQIADQVDQRSRVYDEWGFRRRMNRGLGINALFAGESGTGKTMAAEVLANHLRLNLYRIDLSGVVSKYIGETEKNLRRLFDAAEDGGALLFFDEADALFGKRSEVKDSHDRYANIEINYLLQRMEAYHGLAILATNMRSALDQAFVRRLRFIVTFPFPAAADRKTIWQRAFPPETPTGRIDWDRLARLNLTGGSIHNIAVNAAFRAAHEGTDVRMPILLEMARNEYRKMERPINESEFRWGGAPREVVA